MSTLADLASLPRSSFPYVERHTTRWNDNDVYGHINNVVHYMLIDATVNGWLIREGGLDIQRDPAIGLCVESGCQYHAALEYPAPVDVALRVGHLGRSSVEYQLALFAPDAERPAANGRFVHVFVGRHDWRPTPIPDQLRASLERLAVT
jgi:acyl-CoA thioester hydrolase